MTHADTNAEIWKSPEAVRNWLADVEKREHARLPQWRLMGQLLPFGADDAFTFVDLGAGTGAAARTLLDLYPRSRAVLADFSAVMMDEARALLERFDGRYDYVEFDMTVGDWPDAIPAAVDAVVTSQCVHHLPDDRKQGLFTEILDRLVPGGWYLNFDPVSSSDPIVDEAWVRANDRLDPDAAHKRVHRTPEEAARHANHVRYMLPLEPQLAFLRAAGFEAIDVYWKHLDYVIYGGRRPA
jgi:tRNA (cmo5U34)-methyltransferase